MNRTEDFERFIAQVGWSGAERQPLPRDASFRSYCRLIAGDGATALVMDAPPDCEPLAPYVLIAGRLRDLGLSAPRVLAVDLAHGFALIEDFGEQTYTRALADGADEALLYQAAIDVLVTLHRTPPGVATDGVSPYSDHLLNRELTVFTDWLLPEILAPAERVEASADFFPLWPCLYGQARRVPGHLVLRDFHVDNLMTLANRRAVRAVGLLDFQDAVAGPVTYDLVSLLGDARRDISDEVQELCWTRYFAAFPELDIDQFKESAAILSAQRNFKILGIFTRQWRRDGRTQYLPHIARVWRLLEKDLRHPALSLVGDWLDRWVPAKLRVVPPLDAAHFAPSAAAEAP